LSVDIFISVSEEVGVGDALGDDRVLFYVPQKEEMPSWLDNITLVQSTVYTESDRITRAGPANITTEYELPGDLREQRGRLIHVWGNE